MSGQFKNTAPARYDAAYAKGSCCVGTVAEFNDDYPSFNRFLQANCGGMCNGDSKGVTVERFSPANADETLLSHKVDHDFLDVKQKNHRTSNMEVSNINGYNFCKFQDQVVLPIVYGASAMSGVSLGTFLPNPSYRLTDSNALTSDPRGFGYTTQYGHKGLDPAFSYQPQSCNFYSKH